MKYLIDTCTFIWLSTDPDKLSKTAGKILQNADNKIIVSTVSPWELALKKDDIIQTDNLENFVKQTCIRHQLTLISPSLSHVCMVKKLPFHHKDPFDRLLIATAIVEKIPLISADRKIALYSIKTIWQNNLGVRPSLLALLNHGFELNLLLRDVRGRPDE